MKRLLVISAILIFASLSCVLVKNQVKTESTETIETVAHCEVNTDTTDKHQNQAIEVLDKDSNQLTKGIVAERIDFKGSSFDVIVVDTRNANIHMFYREKDYKEALLFLSNALSSMPDLQFVMNGGMYSYKTGNPAQFMKPVGLYIEEGKIIANIDTCKNLMGNFYMQPNGIFFIGKDGEPRVIVTEDFPKYREEMEKATQSGPMLLIDSEINNLFKENSINKNIRNGVGVIDSCTVVFAISNEPVNFYDFASLFKDRYDCKNALYLDGAISGAIIPELNRDDSKNNLMYAVFIGAELKKGETK